MGALIFIGFTLSKSTEAQNHVHVMLRKSWPCISKYSNQKNCVVISSERAFTQYSDNSVCPSLCDLLQGVQLTNKFT